MDTTEKTIISLIKSAIYKEKTALPADFDWKRAELIIKAQEIYGLIYFGLYNSGIPVPEWLENTFYRRCSFLTNLWCSADEITAALRQKGVEHVLLKGVVLKDLYPSPYMRYMSDVDLFIHESDYRAKIRPLMLDLGYTEKHESDHEYCWKKDKVTVEFHKRLIPAYNKDFYKVIGDGWGWIKDNEYAYILTHFAKHYRDSGIGIAHLIDLEILSAKATDKGLKELHLEKFYENVKGTLDAWFRGKEFDEASARITETVFKSGLYGSKKTSLKSTNLKKIIASRGNAKKARFKDFFEKIFPPLCAMKIRYGFLRRAPFLLPLAWLFRIIASPFRGNLKVNYEYNKSITENASEYRQELNAVGLDFWF